MFIQIGPPLKANLKGLTTPLKRCCPLVFGSDIRNKEQQSDNADQGV